MKSLIFLGLVLGLNLGNAQAALIVDVSTPPIFNVTGGNENTALVTVADPTDANGLTMNVTFTPSVADITQSTNAINLLEIGGNANGSGLYLLGGQIYFLSKMSGLAADVVTTYPDFAQNDANNMIGVRSSDITGISNGGLLTAGTEYSVAVILDPTIGGASLTLAVQPTGGSLYQESWALTTDGINWAGNNTVVSFNPPSNAGAGTLTAGHPFQEGTSNMVALSGTAGQALIYNEVATVIPEPSSLALVGLALLGFLRYRRQQVG